MPMTMAPLSILLSWRGSPFTLELRKLDRLFTESAAERDEQKRLLAKLKKSRRAFGATTSR